MTIDDMLVPENAIEATMDGKLNKLFIITGLDPNTARFAPKVQKVRGGRRARHMGDVGMCWRCVCGTHELLKATLLYKLVVVNLTAVLPVK